MLRWVFQTCFAVLLCVMSAKTALAADLEVMSFNIRYGTAMEENPEDNWPKRRELVVDMLKAHTPDIVSLQECLELQVEFLVEQLPEYRWFGVGREADGGGEFMAVMYRHDLLSPMASGNFWLSPTPETPGTCAWNSACNRMCTWARFYHRSSKQSFYLFNTHFDHKSEEARQHQAIVLAEQINGIAGDNPIIVTGDFNAVAEESIPYDTLLKSGFSDAWLNATTQKGPPATWCGFKPIDPDSSHRIDWILYRGATKVAEVEAIVFEKNGRFVSDHLPVKANFTIK